MNKVNKWPLNRIICESCGDVTNKPHTFMCRHSMFFLRLFFILGGLCWIGSFVSLFFRCGK